MIIAAVSYLNTKPFIYGIEASNLLQEHKLLMEIPAVVADQLIAGSAAIGLVPVASIPKIKNAHIISDYCIGSNGDVGSVCIYSQEPLNRVATIFLDYQSRTSVQLVKILLKHYWGITPELKAAFPGYENRIKGNAGGLVIGDRCLLLKDQFNYCYDLGKAWESHTGLPFVFACWVTNTKLPANFLALFNEALKTGIDNIPLVADRYKKEFEGIDVNDYLNNKIKFRMDESMKKGMEYFYQLINQSPAY